jgi:hypothetical protein
VLAKLFGIQSAAAVLPENPHKWDLDNLSRFLNGLNPRKERDRTQVRQRMQALERVMQTEMHAPFTSVKMVLQVEVGKLPIHLRLYRELHEYLRIWLW